MTLASRQALLAQVLDDPALEEALRRDPEGTASRRGVPADFCRWLASVDPARIRAFRRSRVHKDGVRAGRPARQLPSL